MQPYFHIRREQIRRLHIERYTQLRGQFHFHSHIELMLIEEGSATAWIGDTSESLYAGEIAIVPSYATHQFHAEQDTVKCTDLFIPTFLCPDFMETVANKQAVHPFIRNPEATKKIREALQELEREDLNPIEQTGYLHVILGTVLRYISFENGGTDENTDLPAQLLLYVNEHFKEDLSTAQIARAMGYTSNYLSECFRSCFHIGINRYINTVRLKNALTLMHENRHTITECAMESGFSSLRTFYRVFTQELGCTPREYLKNE